MTGAPPPAVIAPRPQYDAIQRPIRSRYGVLNPDGSVMWYGHIHQAIFTGTVHL